MRTPAFLTLLALPALASPGDAQPARETVLIEQRVSLGEHFTPAAARRKAMEEAMAEAVRRVAGVRVRSTAVSTTTERDSSFTSEYLSVVQLDAAGRAVDVRLVAERWETGAAGPRYHASYSVTVEREQGESDPGFSLELTLPAREYRAPSRNVRANDELLPVARSSRAATLFLFSVVGDTARQLLPHPLTGPVSLAADAAQEVPDAVWRERGMRLRVTSVPPDTRRDELLVGVAIQGVDVPAFTGSTVLEFQQWLVRIPLGARALAFAPYVVLAR